MKQTIQQQVADGSLEAELLKRFKKSDEYDRPIVWWAIRQARKWKDVLETAGVDALTKAISETTTRPMNVSLDLAYAVAKAAQSGKLGKSTATELFDLAGNCHSWEQFWELCLELGFAEAHSSPMDKGLAKAIYETAETTAEIFARFDRQKNPSDHLDLVSKGAPMNKALQQFVAAIGDEPIDDLEAIAKANSAVLLAGTAEDLAQRRLFAAIQNNDLPAQVTFARSLRTIRVCKRIAQTAPGQAQFEANVVGAGFQLTDERRLAGTITASPFGSPAGDGRKPAPNVVDGIGARDVWDEIIVRILGAGATAPVASMQFKAGHQTQTDVEKRKRDETLELARTIGAPQPDWPEHLRVNKKSPR
jgi:hypothetical protein